MNTSSFESDPNRSADDLTWQAFRYVNGELSADESAAFETRLSEDTQVAAALSQVLTLEDHLESAFRDRPTVTVLTRPSIVSVSDARAANPNAPSTPLGRWGMPSMIAASLLACGLAGYFLNATPDARFAAPTSESAVAAVESPAVIDSWLEAAMAVPEVPGGDLPSVNGDVIELAMLDTPGLEAEIVPDWMYAACEPETDEEVVE